jgi:hypothetical protein
MTEVRESSSSWPLTRALLLVAAFLAVRAAPVHAQQPAAPADSATPAGIWRGTSLCTPGHPTCHDETVVYRIAPKDGRFEINASKIVAGQEEFMGTITCDFTAASGLLNCPTNYGLWSFTVRGEDMQGTLQVGSELWRRVAVTRSAT